MGFPERRRRTAGALRAVALLLLVLGAALASGCGEHRTPGPAPRTDATLVLDYLPNGVHAGIYRALAAGYYDDRGIDLKVVTPTSTADTLRLVESGKADLGLADGIDVATRIAAGGDVKAVAALTQRPAGGLITLASSGITSPADLAGRTVGVTGLPSDTAVLRTMVRDDGGDPAAVREVTLGFNGPQAVISGRVAAFTGYIPADSPVISMRGKPVRSFAFDRFGGPSYPGLVFFARGTRIAKEPSLMADFAAATARGYRDALAHPESAIGDLVAAADGLDRGLAAATFRAYRPFIGPAELFGRIRPEGVKGLSRFLRDNGLIRRTATPARFGRGPGATDD